MVVRIARRKFTVEQYHRMGESGVFAPDERVELIDGEIVEMSPIGPNHAAAVKRLLAIFAARLGPRVLLGVQDPVTLGPRSEPQPDVALLEPKADFYACGHPSPKDILLLIEVSDTTQRYDREVKMPHYARVGIREAWLVDLVSDRIEIYRKPGQGGYGELRKVGRGEKLAPLAFPRCALRVEEIVG
ncbi:MAG: Uma2 family endonuclease [Planctomycetes bacterium]|nr:Uma2 family endonuclease [Planctomycetota bacterium]